jgi:hypothetical protein
MGHFLLLVVRQHKVISAADCEQAVISLTETGALDGGQAGDGPAVDSTRE